MNKEYYESYESGEHLLIEEGEGTECDTVIGIWSSTPTTDMKQDCIYRRQQNGSNQG